ncbi:MAG: GAF domain-containing protein, partial [Candidatus Cloacimonetes bacterium]|nr:GAF domain-containing protein [Candidatus Cloacimonadota bacterium]
FSTFAQHVSIIIENAILQAQKKRKMDQLLSLQKLSKKTTSTLNLRKLLQIISTNALKITRASHGMLLLIDSECEYLKVVSLKGYKGISKKNCKIRIGEGIVGWVTEKGIPLLVNDVRKEPKYIEVIQEIKSELAVPLISEEKVLGALGVSSTENAAFSQDDLELLMIFASHAATLIKNARLYEEIITERNFAENIIESSPNGFFTVGLDRKISAINPMAEEIFNVHKTAIMGRRVSEVFEIDIVDIVESALTSESIISDKEIIAKRKDGSYIILGVSSSLLRSHAGSVIGVLVIVRDLTDLKKTEDLIRRMDRVSSLGQLSAGIAHEIRNPLASINFNVQMLSKKLSLDEKLQDIMDDTLIGINRIKRLVKGIHDFAKPGSTLVHKGNINNVIVDSISLLDSQLKKKKIKTYVNLQEEIPSVIFDPLKMQQVFINLIINAMEAMPEGGILKITSRIENNYKNDAGQLVIYFTDNGIGIPSQNYSKIFDPFFTTKPEGTGLGLSITHKILEQHNALIDAESIEKKGTTFIIKFPINTDMKDETSLQNINR